eukprot:1941414-Lingulodinium_polyedra.AAC.1
MVAERSRAPNAIKAGMFAQVRHDPVRAGSPRNGNRRFRNGVLVPGSARSPLCGVLAAFRRQRH